MQIDLDNTNTLTIQAEGEWQPANGDFHGAPMADFERKITLLLGGEVVSKGSAYCVAFDEDDAGNTNVVERGWGIAGVPWITLDNEPEIINGTWGDLESELQKWAPDGDGDLSHEDACKLLGVDSLFETTFTFLEATPQEDGSTLIRFTVEGDATPLRKVAEHISRRVWPEGAALEELWEENRCYLARLRTTRWRGEDA